MAEPPGDTKQPPKGVTHSNSSRLYSLRRARQIRKEKKLSVLSKLCYAVGGAPNQVAGSASSFFLQIYLLDVAQITPLHTSLVLSIGKVWGGITDPVVGYFINKSKWTKIGRLMPWIIGCTPFLTVSYFFLWFAPPFVTGRVLWYLAFYALFQALTTVFHVPYATLTMFLSTDQKERDSATAYRMMVEVLGTLIGAAVQGQIVASAHTSAHCVLHNGTVNLIENVTEIAKVPNNSSLSQSLAFQFHAEKVYMIAAGVIGGVYLFCTAILFLGVTEKDDPYALNSDSVMPFFRGFKLTVKYRPYLNLTAAFLLISAAVQEMIIFLNLKIIFPMNVHRQQPRSKILQWCGEDEHPMASLVEAALGHYSQGNHNHHLLRSFGIVTWHRVDPWANLEQSNFVLFCTHAADLRDHFQNLVLTILISAVVSIPFWQWFLQRFGKKSAAFGISWMIPFAVMLVTIPNRIVAYLVAVTSGLSIAASLLLPWSMLPDVVDNFRLQNPQAKGLETIFYSSFVFFTRLSAGIALGISSLSLEFAGYSTGACKKSYGVAITLKVLIGVVPAFLIIIGYRPKRRPTLLG
ncbi:major facilitator superfamily domain-containing protein 2B isoform X2 [Rhinatrema bivittatum]|uniref:major facilitator superfamily domain-containing protein 2B isoform X2 n=1 Tax=Rhinatrema bivittatum TaxID=194408 RepID=UPI001128FBEF|nr:major facilitator superfamily domain-containing protein 2B isoform X2 [Rhinatrema bivittatum]